MKITISALDSYLYEQIYRVIELRDVMVYKTKETKFFTLRENHDKFPTDKFTLTAVSSKYWKQTTITMEVVDGPEDL